MGVPQYSISTAPVIKATTAILGLTATTRPREADAPALHPLRPVRAAPAPMRLMPTYLATCTPRPAALDAVRAPMASLDCIECGACTYVCPGKLPLVQGIRSAKQQILSARRK